MAIASKLAARQLHRKYTESARFITTSVLSDKAPTVEQIDLTDHFVRSTKTLGDYVTLDWNHRSDIRRIMGSIARYSSDRSRKRPHNILMLAEPGSGKSHLIRCLAKNMADQGVSAVSYNMATMRSLDDLAQPLEAIRNLKIEDRLPLLFLDEFDCNPLRNYPILLPLLWDGELHVGHQDLKLGKLVIILAGSSSEIPKIMHSAREMRTDDLGNEEAGKLVDLLSRINGGVLEIPKLDLVEDDRDRRSDKVCLSLSLLQHRFGRRLECVPWSLLHFIGMSTFRYGVRSIAHLIDTIPWGEELQLELRHTMLRLPLRAQEHLVSSSLAYHLTNPGGPSQIVSDWLRIADVSTRVRFNTAPQEEAMP